MDYYTHPDQRTDEAKATRTQRAAWRKAPADPLAERQRLAKFWAKCNETNKAYGLVHARSFYRGQFKRHLLPATQAHIKARDAERKRAYQEEMREECRQWAEKKSHEKKLAKAPPLPLFAEVA
jgi:hypothetical protein